MKDIQQHIKSDLDSLHDTINKNISSAEDLIPVVSRYIIDGSGKRIRPIFTILVSRMFGHFSQEMINLAAAVELIHTATLLHDDVVDNGTMRRFKPSANTVWGNKISILVGDFLLSKAFSLMIESGSNNAMRSLSRAAAIIAEGEIYQLRKLDQRYVIDISEYERIITAKTSALFASACQIGAIIAGQENGIVDIIYNFGFYIGNIFQIRDDLLDYIGEPEEIGKNIGEDFFEGKVTLPLILLYDKLDLLGKENLENLLKKDERSHVNFDMIKDLIKEYEIDSDIVKHLEQIASKALVIIRNLPQQNIYKNFLIELSDSLVKKIN